MLRYCTYVRREIDDFVVVLLRFLQVLAVGRDSSETEARLVRSFVPHLRKRH